MKEIDDLVRSAEDLGRAMGELGTATRSLFGTLGITLSQGVATAIGAVLLLAVVAVACFVVVGLARVIHRRMRS